MTGRVAMVHGDREPRLHRIRETYLALAGELSDHLMKEERVLFPMVRQLDGGAPMPDFHCGTLGNPVDQMEREHGEAEEMLGKLRELTDNYAPPKWACGTYRAMLAALSRLEGDTLVHIHKESALLFPRAIEAERARGVLG